MTIVKPHPARPKFSLGQTVEYTDRFGRIQTGTVINIEAKWSIHKVSGNEHATIAYTVTHPTFHVGHVYVVQDFLSEVGGNEVEG